MSPPIAALPRVRVATRGSALALAQARLVAAALTSSQLVGSVDVVVVRTRGDVAARRLPQDRGTSAPLVDTPGWFTAELEAAVGEGRADCAVHSAKDLPTTLGPGMSVVAHLPRGDCRDALVTADGRGLSELAPGATVATGSPRRMALIGALRRDLHWSGVRGNVDTRLRRLDEGRFDALVLAACGLERLGLGARISERFDPTVVVPAPAQGAIVVECRAGSEVAEVCALIDDAATTVAVTAERAVLRGVGGGCRQALGAWATVEGTTLTVVAALGIGDRVVRVTEVGSADEPEVLGGHVAEQLLAGAAVVP